MRWIAKGSSGDVSGVALYVIEEAAFPDRGYFLFRYNKARQLIGDTWHETAEAAFEQIAFECGEAPIDVTELDDSIDYFAIADMR